MFRETKQSGGYSVRRGRILSLKVLTLQDGFVMKMDDDVAGAFDVTEFYN